MSLSESYESYDVIGMVYHNHAMKFCTDVHGDQRMNPIN